MDFTSILRTLPRNKKAVLFNPSIAWLERDYYIISVRSFIRNLRNKNTQIDKIRPDPHKTFEHPWYGGSDSDSFWRGDVHETWLYLVKISNKNKIKVLYTHPNPLKDIYDMRLFTRVDLKMNKKGIYKVIATANADVDIDDDRTLATGDTCYFEDECEIISQYTITVDINKNTMKYRRSVEGLCMNLSQEVEKNWTYWKYKNRYIISYMLTPLFKNIVYNGKNLKSCKFLTMKSKKPNIFDKIINYYKFSKSKKGIILSLSTPSHLIRYKSVNGNEQPQYIGMGHIKISDEFLNKISKSERLSKKYFNLKKWMNKIKWSLDKYYHHDMYAYLSFFYLFEVHSLDNIDIIGLSDFFLIEGYKPYLLQFVGGLAYNQDNNQLKLTYADADLNCKLLNISGNDALKLIKKNNKPEDFRFGSLQNFNGKFIS